MTLRPWLLRLHLWLGLVCGLFITVLSLTGTALVYRAELDRALNPGLYQVSAQVAPKPTPDLVATAAARHPELPLTRINLPKTAADPLVVQFKGDRQVFIDPGTGTVLGERTTNGHLMGWVLDLHRHLLAGETGNQIVEWASIALFFLSASGLILWLPRRLTQAKFKVALPPGAPYQRVSREWHLVLGLYSAVFLMIASWTGAAFVHQDRFVAFYAWATGHQGPMPEAPKATAKALGPGAPVAAVLDAAATTFPGASPTSIRYPKGKGGVIRVIMKQPGDVHPNGNTWVYVDAQDARVVGVLDPAKAPLAWKLFYAYNYALHTGEIAGPIGRLVALVVSPLPAVLCLTGTLMFFGKWRARRRTAAARQAPQPVGS
ncbi:PepSY domain-containing protein [bacterium]|nr:PepSY domain-containing protein [bacterium]